mmetsp:Transcript_19393/g.45123  ORF Transcript_19393/g.45123 Transcript_19393/m.45123 type:complete len:374 (+) Transcript_19393:8-1129(+)
MALNEQGSTLLSRRSLRGGGGLGFVLGSLGGDFLCGPGSISGAQGCSDSELAEHGQGGQVERELVGARGLAAGSTTAPAAASTALLGAAALVSEAESLEHALLLGDGVHATSSGDLGLGRLSARARCLGKNLGGGPVQEVLQHIQLHELHRPRVVRLGLLLVLDTLLLCLSLEAHSLGLSGGVLLLLALALIVTPRAVLAGLRPELVLDRLDLAVQLVVLRRELLESAEDVAHGLEALADGALLLLGRRQQRAHARQLRVHAGLLRLQTVALTLRHGDGALLLDNVRPRLDQVLLLLERERVALGREPVVDAGDAGIQVGRTISHAHLLEPGQHLVASAAQSSLLRDQGLHGSTLGVELGPESTAGSGLATSA